jgi:hypothetical protein
MLPQFTLLVEFLHVFFACKKVYRTPVTLYSIKFSMALLPDQDPDNATTIHTIS